MKATSKNGIIIAPTVRKGVKNSDKIKGHLSIIVISLLMAGCRSSSPVPPSSETACSTIASWQTAHPSRGWNEQTVSYENIAVEHRSLYLQDCFESRSACRGPAQIYRKDDILSLAGSPLMFLGNIIKLPIDMAQSPPCRQQASRSNYPLLTSTYNIPYEETCPAESSTME